MKVLNPATPTINVGKKKGPIKIAIDFRKRGRPKKSPARCARSKVFGLLLPSITACPTQWQGIFCFLFVAAWTKRKASGGTRPAGVVIRKSTLLKLKQKSKQTIISAGLARPGALLFLTTKKSNQKKVAPPFARLRRVPSLREF
ncbi:hypothetical protein A7E78_10650 [Syntrophotalea acetylenivorans]|uniref:Uncharacterized protein n=1 Tax=Syntrophotalea acetylenivorans TaxID=1842532 RepID=A0A1L3GQS6_9BACT|nr:hypothetical protein A7E78_10650 [Syntrophotalea acetylenivorans]